MVHHGVPGREGEKGLWRSTEGLWFSLVAQTAKNLPAMQKTWVQPLGWEDPLEKGMATASNTPAWRILWTEEPGGLYPWGCRVGHD